MDQDQEGTALGLDITDDKKIGDKEGGVGKLVKLRAFNLFASKIRDSIKDENPVANGHEIKRIVGQKWAQLANGDKQEFIDVAQNENDLIEKLPVDPNAPKRKRRRRTKAEIEMDDAPAPRKRKGKSSKDDDDDDDVDDDIHGETGNGVVPSAEGPPKRKRVRKQVDAAGKAVDPAYVGKAVSGTVDGSFDAGYLVTVRVGDTDMVFRGVLFEPSISMPPNNTNDVAPGIKSVRRNDGIAYPPSGSASSSKQNMGGSALASGTVTLVK